MSHVGPLNRPDWLVLFVYLGVLAGSIVVGVVFAVGWRRRLERFRGVAAVLAIGTVTGTVILVSTGLLLGTRGAVGGFIYGLPLFGGGAVGTLWLYRKRGLAPVDAALYATLGTAIGVPGGLFGAFGVFLLVTFLGALHRGIGPIFEILALLAEPVVAVAVPVLAARAVASKLAGNFDPLPGQRKLAVLGVALGLVALPVAGLAYPEVPVGNTPPALPDRPAELNNETVAEYVGTYEATRQHRAAGGSGGCKARVVDRRTAARYLAAESLGSRHEYDDWYFKRLDRKTEQRLAELPGSDGYFAVVDCNWSFSGGSPILELHGHGFWEAVYYVNESTTARQGKGREPPSTSRAE